MASAFFYGTLMHPLILKRVIGHEGSDLQICPAILLDYTRHHVQHADYPGILPYSQSVSLFKEDLEREERCVRGSLVTGLSDTDLHLLDEFEGDEYTREDVTVHPISPLISLSAYVLPTEEASATDSLVPAKAPPLPAVLSKAVSAQTYIFKDICSIAQTKGIWTFEDFVRTSAWKWHGKAADERQDIVHVDMIRQRLDTQRAGVAATTASAGA